MTETYFANKVICIGLLETRVKEKSLRALTGETQKCHCARSHKNQLSTSRKLVRNSWKVNSTFISVSSYVMEKYKRRDEYHCDGTVNQQGNS